MDVTVFHTDIPDQGGKTTFSGMLFDYSVSENGALQIRGQVSYDMQIDVLFAPGRWTCVHRSGQLGLRAVQS